MNTASGLPPSITVSTFDMDRLDAMLESPALSQTPAALALAEELNRATVLAPDQIPEGIVMMHSRVECEDEVSGEKHVLTLVFPAKPTSMKARFPCWPRSAVPCSAFRSARASTGPRPAAASCACA